MKKIFSLLFIGLFSSTLGTNILNSYDVSSNKNDNILNQMHKLSDDNWTPPLWFASPVKATLTEEEWISCNGYIDVTKVTGKTGEKYLLSHYDNMFVKCYIELSWGKGYNQRNFSFATNLTDVNLTDEQHVPSVDSMEQVFYKKFKSGLATAEGTVTFGGCYLADQTSGDLILKLFFGLNIATTILTDMPTLTVNANFINLHEIKK